MRLPRATKSLSFTNSRIPAEVGGRAVYPLFYPHPTFRRTKSRMKTPTKHLCLIIDRNSGVQLAEYTITVEYGSTPERTQDADWYWARHRAAAQFRKDNPSARDCWYVDSLDVTSGI